MRRLGLALLPLLLAAEAFARAGGGGGYHGGGGGGFSSGGGFHGSGGGGAGLGWLVYWYIQLVFEHPLIGLPLTAFLVYLYYKNVGFRSSFGSGGAVDSLPDSAMGAYSTELDTRRREALAVIRGRDPGFDEEKFLARAAGAFLVIQDAWSSQDMSKARAFISDGVFERFARQIAEHKSLGARNRMTNVNVEQTEALGYLAGEHYDSVYVRVRAAAVDEMVSLEGEQVLSGGPSEFEEVWTFLRRPGVKTLARPGLLEGHCPSCGAPLSIADAARCEACKAWVNSGEHDWVLVGITQMCEWSFPSPEREVTGWEALRETDPGLSLEALEDRASVAFWRWQDARRRQDPAPLRGVATDEFLKGLTFDGKCAREAAVGAVETIAFEAGVDFDRVHVQVRWEASDVSVDDKELDSGERMRRTHYLIFKRKSGATSDLKAGLRTSRCPSCGAPPAEADAAKCTYCGRAFNDGSLTWILVDIVPFGVWQRPVAGPSAPMSVVGLDWGENLPPVEAVAVLAMGLSADGVVDDREKAFLTAYAEKRGVPPGRTEELLQAALSKKLDLPPPTDPAQAESILRGLIRMELADGIITKAEQDLLNAYAARVGLGTRDLGQMIKEERLALQARAATLVARRAA